MSSQTTRSFVGESYRPIPTSTYIHRQILEKAPETVVEATEYVIQQSR